MGPKALEGIQDALSGTDGAPWAVIFMGLALLGILVLFVHLTVVQVRRHGRLKVGWEELARTAARYKLAHDETLLIRDLARREAPMNPVDVVRRPEIFERAVHRHLKRLGSSSPGSQEGQRACALISSLRGKLALRHSGGETYYSTRTLPEGQELFLTIEGDRTSALKARTGVAREDLLELVDVQPAGARLRGRSVNATFYPRKGAFSFSTDVVRVDPAGGTCLLNHSVDVRRASRRSYHRVQVGQPVTFRAAWEGDAVTREGTLCDLSAGGASVEAPCYYEANESLVFDVRPGVYLPDADEGEGARPIRGTVVMTQQRGGDVCLYHVEFRQISADDRQFLVDLVRRIERAERSA